MNAAGATPCELWPIGGGSESGVLERVRGTSGEGVGQDSIVDRASVGSAVVEAGIGVVGIRYEGKRKKKG